MRACVSVCVCACHEAWQMVCFIEQTYGYCHISLNLTLDSHSGNQATNFSNENDVVSNLTLIGLVGIECDVNEEVGQNVLLT